MSVKRSGKNSTFVQKETRPSVTLKVNLILVLDVNFILILSNLYFDLIF
jgi:hypothetical protein